MRETCLPKRGCLGYVADVTAAGEKSEVLGGGFRVGDTLAGRYVLERKLGRGGMGVVVAGRRLADGQRVAIKLLLTDTSESLPKNAARLIREAKATAALTDEHVVRLYDVDTLDDGTCFLVMELLEGEDLFKVVRSRGPLPLTEAVDMVLQASAGVAEAHARGIVHRDLKPHNLFLSRRSMGPPLVKVLDFGISKFDDGDDAQLTTTGAALGSPQYMAIEQFQNSKYVDRRVDIWALGMILQYLLTGRTAYAAPDVATYLFRLSTEKPTPLRVQRADVPAGVEAVVLRCLEKNPNARFVHVGELAQSLAPWAGPTSFPILDRIRHYAGFMPPVAEVPAPLENSQPLMPHAVLQGTPLPSGTHDPVAREHVTTSGRNQGSKALVLVAALGIVAIGLAGFVVMRSSSDERPVPVPVSSDSAIPGKVVMTVAVTPAHATLEINGRRVTSPFELARSEQEQTLLVQADGYAAKTKMIRPTANVYLEIALDALAATPPSATVQPKVGATPPPAASPAGMGTNRKKRKGPMTESL